MLDLEWAKDGDGYGEVKLNGRRYRSHRVAYLLHHDRQPSDFCVCHSCDVRLCCNPTHLFLGTHADNTDDMMSKGRGMLGEKAHHAKLTAAEVKAIRCSTLPQQALAAQYGVHQSLISKSQHHHCWRHV